MSEESDSVVVQSAAVKMIGVFVITAIILILFYNNLLFGLSVKELDDYLTVFTAVTLFAALWILLSSRGSKK